MKETAPEIPRSKRPDVFGYHDFGTFFRDWLSFLKVSRPGFSLRSLAKEAGVATGYLPMVLSGKRKLSTKAWVKISAHLGTNQSEKAYLNSLQSLGEADSHSAQLEVVEKLQRFQGYKKQNPKEMEAYRYLTHWYYVAIREMAVLPDFKPDPKWIQGKLLNEVSLHEVKKALDFLVKNGFLELKKNGEVSQREKSVECEGGVYRLLLGKFHREMLQLASRSTENTPSPNRKLGGHTLAISENHFDSVKAILDEALEKINQLGIKEETTTAIYHVALAAFPLTRI